MGVTRAPTANGVWEIVGAPTNFSKAYMVYGDIDSTVVSGNYAVYISSNSGQTSWTKTLTFSTNQTVLWGMDGHDLPNSARLRLTNQKMVVDPVNPNVAYVGMPFAVTLTGTHAGSTASVFRTLDGGATWSVVPGLPAPANYPGYAGMCIDKSSATTSFGGQSVKSRIILPCPGVGVYESTNGGSSFTKVSSDPTPPTTLSITTTQANSIIIVQILCYGISQVVNVTNTGTSALTWTLRSGPNRNDFLQLFLYEYYAVAPSAGTYNVSVNYVDGALAYLTNSTNTASCTAGTITGTAFTEAGTTTGAFAIGQELTGTGLPASTASAVVGLGNGIYIVSGSSPNWVINSPYTLTARVINGRTRVANEVNVFAVKGCDVSAMPDSAFDSGGPQISNAANALVPITTVANNCLVFVFGYSKNVPGTTTAESGYTAMGMSGLPSFWSQISTSPVAAGLRSPGSTVNSHGLLSDALKQGAGMTIALDGTAVFATSNPAPCNQPVSIFTAQMDNAGTYWCVDGPFPKSQGGVWRYKSSVWERVSGSPGAVAAGLTFATPSAGSAGNAICVDPRPGKEGFITFTGPFSLYRGFQTQNGNASLASMTWNGVTGGTLTTNVSSSIPWFDTGATTSQGKPVGDMVIDPVTGQYWASGEGSYEIDSDLRYASTGFICNSNNLSQGQEEILVADVLAIPGAPNLLVGCEDMLTLLTDLPRHPSAQVGPAHVDSHNWGLDYASDNPAFVWAFTTGLATARASCWSNNYGADGSWVYPTTFPPVAGSLGGCMACATTGADGLSASNATANVVIIPGAGTVTPVYTLNNGATWPSCVGLPTQSYIGTKERPTKLLAADRVTIGTYYCYAPGTGVYRSTDFGANWTLRTPGFIVPGGGGSGAGYMLLPVPGYAGHLWLVGNNASLGTQQLNYSTDGGANWAQVAGVTNATNPGGTSTPIYLALGKAAPGNPYPTLLTYAKISTVDGFYRGVCNGAGPASGFTWTKFGDRTSVPSSNVLGSGSASGFSQIWGDPNVFGRLYVGWAQNGVFMFNP
jgi:hypothetical protein